MSNVTPSSTDKIADEIQPVIDAVEAITPADEVSKVKAFVAKYLKGEIALVLVVASFVVEFLPIESLAFHITSAVIGAATVAGVVIARNTK